MYSVRHARTVYITYVKHAATESLWAHLTCSHNHKGSLWQANSRLNFCRCLILYLLHFLLLLLLLLFCALLLLSVFVFMFPSLSWSLPFGLLLQLHPGLFMLAVT